MIDRVRLFAFSIWLLCQAVAFYFAWKAYRHRPGGISFVTFLGLSPTARQRHLSGAGRSYWRLATACSMTGFGVMALVSLALALL